RNYSLVGATFFFQGLISDPANNPAGLRTTSGLHLDFQAPPSPFVSALVFGSIGAPPQELVHDVALVLGIEWTRAARPRCRPAALTCGPPASPPAPSTAAGSTPVPRRGVRRGGHGPAAPRARRRSRPRLPATAARPRARSPASAAHRAAARVPAGAPRSPRAAPRAAATRTAERADAARRRHATPRTTRRPADRSARR